MTVGGNDSMSATPMLDKMSIPLVFESPEEEAAYKKQKELEEFYSTYDVWTGVRTAITLALFFLFTVSVIVYKSRCKKTKRYDMYPPIEDMPERPLDYCDYWCTSPLGNEIGAKRGMGRIYEKGGVGMGSAPLPTQGSIGSYSSLATSFRVKSLPGSVMAINWSRMSSYEKEDVTTSQSRSEFLRVPGVHQQVPSSSSEVYSTGSSAHDLRISVPTIKTRPVLQLGGMDWDSDHATAEWLQTIDINVIQPTPNISPCSSMRSVSDHTGSFDQATTLHPSLRSTSRQSTRLEDDAPSMTSDSLFFDASASSYEESSSSRSAHRRHTQPNLFFATPTFKPKVPGPTLLALPTATNLSGSCEKLSVQPLAEKLRESGTSLQAVPSIEEDPQMMSYKVPNLRRTASAQTNGGTRNSSLKAKRPSPIKRAESATNPVKRCDSSGNPRKYSSGSTSSTDEASESVSFHLMAPQLSMDCPSQDVSRASTPSLSPTPPPTPPTPPSKRPLCRTRPTGAEGRGVLRRQFARDFTQPCIQLPAFPEEVEPFPTLTITTEAIKPPPGYRDPSPIPSLPPTPNTTCPSPVPPTPPPIPLSPLPYPLSPSPNSMMMMQHSMSPIPPPPSPLYSQVPTSPLPQARSPSLILRVSTSEAHGSSSPGTSQYSPYPSVAGRFLFTDVDRRVGRQRSYSAMTPISIDVPDDEETSPTNLHESSC